MSIAVTDACRNMEEELTGWKTKMQSLLRKMETLREADRERMFPNVRDLNACIAEMSVRIEQLKTECPAALAASIEEMEQATVDMRSRYEETLEYIGRHAPVSIPG